MSSRDERDAVDGAARRRQPRRERQEEQPRCAATRVCHGRPSNSLESMPRAKKLVGLGRLAREQPLRSSAVRSRVYVSKNVRRWPAALDAGAADDGFR